MTDLSSITQGIARDYAGLPATFTPGDRRVHPDDGVIVLVSGAFQVGGRVSNHWRWRVEATGEQRHGYGGDWPLAPAATINPARTLLFMDEFAGARSIAS